MSELKSRLKFIGLMYAILLLIYSALRVVFFYYNQQDADVNISYTTIFLNGVRFDLSAIMLVNGIFSLLLILPVRNLTFKPYFQSFLEILFIVSNGLFIGLNFIDIVYFPFVQKRMQNDALLFLNGDKGHEAFGMLPTFIMQFWFIWLMFGLVIWILIRVIKKASKSMLMAHQTTNPWYQYLSIIPILIGLHILGIRGGTQLRPIGVLDAATSGGVRNAPFVLNSTFSLIKTWKKKTLEEKLYFKNEELIGCFSPVKSIIADTTGIKKKYNVVIIMVESLSKEYLSFFGGTGHTPFLDSLMEKSLVYSNGFANARESVQGIPAVLASLPAWMDEPFIFSRYSTNKINSLASLLKPHGYFSSFFHGAATGSMGFHSFTSACGFDAYFGRENYGNEVDFDGSWGIWDHRFLPFMIDKLNNNKEPFLAACLTLNSHHPFLVPKNFKVPFPSKDYPILNSIQYVDQTLADFFAKARQEKWYNNTIFIITADHTGPNTSLKKSAMDDYRIPIIFYKPDGTLKGVNETVINQVDIMPTVLGLLGIEEKVFTFGRNISDNTCEKFVINYKMGIYQYVDKQHYAYFDGEKTIGLYNWNADPLLNKNMIKSVEMENVILEIEEKIKKSIQSFQHTILQNTMTADEN